MESKINRITDILRGDYGISGEMMYTKQILWQYISNKGARQCKNLSQTNCQSKKI